MLTSFNFLANKNNGIYAKNRLRAAYSFTWLQIYTHSHCQYSYFKLLQILNYDSIICLEKYKLLKSDHLVRWFKNLKLILNSCHGVESIWSPLPAESESFILNL